MEASVVKEAPPEEPTATYDGEAEATRSTEELFEWSGYVHTGKGAAECENRLGGCTDSAHFHAWVCLPNPFQIRDIDDKARAGEARKLRALNDAGDPAKNREPSDSYVTLEAALDALRYDEEALEEVREGIVGRALDKQLPSIIAEMAEDDRFEHQAQHAEEMRRLAKLPEDERDEEEFQELRQIMEEYGNALQERIDHRRQIERAAVDRLGIDEILGIERRNRCKNLGEETYLHVYYTWCMYVCTYEPTSEGLPSQRKFPDLQKLRSAAPEIVRDLRTKLSELEQRTTRRGEAAGNS